ncbi:MAG: site-specific DNA-methyltransferase [Phycisphaerales bacterium]|nr:MAG: site-specific DNA-methyltransferase [Phycisphaerales bacterium]
MGRHDHLTFRGNVALGRHGWLRLTPAYSLHLVRRLLARYGPHDVVLEPFSGTGTTPLACAAAGIRCHAVDINPFLVWLCKLKLTRFDDGVPAAVVKAAARVADAAREPGAPAWQPDLHQIEKWWDAPTLGALGCAWEAIRKPRRPRAPAVTELLSIAFCRTMIQTAHVSLGHQSMSFKKPGDDVGLLSEPSGDARQTVVNAFLAAAREVADSLVVEPPVVDCEVVLGDSRHLPAALPSDRPRYTVVVTSPPYPNRMSYIRELRPYMYWLGYLSNGRAAGELDWQAIGGTWGCATSLLNGWTPNGQGQIPFPHFDRIVEEIGRGHALLGRYVHKYFEDIKSHIVGLRDVLAPGAHCHYIVGNSKFYDTLLPVEGIYAALFEDAGFVDVGVETIRKRTSKKELFEFIVHAHVPHRPRERSARGVARSSRT